MKIFPNIKALIKPDKLFHPLLYINPQNHQEADDDKFIPLKHQRFTSIYILYIFYIYIHCVA